ncbi:Putative auto-transporter adhesin, head GIN domain [Sphingomonas gellani]|uniref:Putative auto-transporter adhesin, head GIN domain n=1 Tax=Sphingomonas gellani TaxID=1166340 RepID=A0A1H8H9G3_9SPHN|nr:head GIN domain-containing protein [Sphingomonas gellani]SEN52664.1 Putative auto-transporter adhesin, head GIN domain [Sphingomonas gellani]
MIRPTYAALTIALATLSITACSAKSISGGSDVPATGSGGERRFAVSGFDEVGLSTSADVDIRVGPDFSVVATGAPAALDKLRVRKSGNTVDLGQERGVSWSRGDTLHITITMPRIKGASIGGSGSISVDRVAGDSFDGNIGGSGRLSLAQVNVTTASFAVGGSGAIDAAGHARRTEVSIGGSGKVRNSGLVAEDADITIAGAGDVQVNATRAASVSLVGSGDVTVTGGAKCKVSKMGSGKVRCG